MKEMEGEMKNFIKVWITVYISLFYCYFIASRFPKGQMRLLSILPIISLFIFLPFNLSSIHLTGYTAFFITWLANFKLLLFSFDQGPLSSHSSISLFRFISIASLPIKIKQNPKSSLKPSPILERENPSPQNPKSSLKSSPNLERKNPSPQINRKDPISPVNYAIKGVLLALLIRVYDYKQYIHPNLLLFLYCFHIYFFLEISLAMVAYLARAFLGLELEPQFNDPYLSTSLQDFWGRRWNLMVTSILRPTIYDPIRSISTRILGKKWALIPAILATFIVSGVMHELILYYLGRMEPTWEITWFFILHGFCLVTEIALKKAVKGRWRLHRAITGPLTVAFVVVTGFWLFFPQFLRCGADIRALAELAAVGDFVKDIGRVLRLAYLNIASA